MKGISICLEVKNIFLIPNQLYLPRLCRCVFECNAVLCLFQACEVFSKLHSDKDHRLDYLLVTVAVTGQQGLTPASSKLPSSHPAVRSVVNGCPGDDHAPAMVVPHHWSEGPPWLQVVLGMGMLPLNESVDPDPVNCS